MIGPNTYKMNGNIDYKIDIQLHILELQIIVAFLNKYFSKAFEIEIIVLYSLNIIILFWMYFIQIL